MLQALLVDRFKLKFHRENKDVPGYALVVAKKRSQIPGVQERRRRLEFRRLSETKPRRTNRSHARKVSMATLASLLSGFAPGPVIDQTGLNGEYDFKLSWDETAGPSLVTAVQEQLGLRLNAQKVPLSFFVIESAQRPSAN